ncbi:MAG: 6-phosphofructokinase [Bacteroidetes bacterium]|nr:6-phosphofructokinase [Bacteroidota bacterium]
MIIDVGHAGMLRHVAVNTGAGFVPGTNAIVMGAAIAGNRLGWEMTGIRDGFEGLLHPERYPDGGLITLDPGLIENLDPSTGGILGQAPWTDPLYEQVANADKNRKEEDLPLELLKRLNEKGIDGLISIVGGQGLGILHKIHLKGFHTVCIPRSIENDIASTAVSFGFNSALSITIDMLSKAYQAARSASKIAVVEVPGEHAGWIALQAGIAVRADVVLITEIPCDLKNVASRLKDKISPRRPYGLVVVAEGAKFDDSPKGQFVDPVKPIVPPIGAGKVAVSVATALQKMIDTEIYPLSIGPWARGGNPTATDHQLGIAYGAWAVKTLRASKNGVMVSFVPPDIKYVPLEDVINKVRTVSADSEFLKIAGALGIYFGNFSSKM